MPILTRSALAEASWAAAIQWLAVEYSQYSGKRLDIVVAKTADDFRQIGRAISKDGNNEVPLTNFGIMSIGTIGIDTEVGGLKKNRVGNGVMTGKDRASGISYHDSLRPAIIEIGFAYVCPGLDELFLIAETLLNAAPVVTLSLEMDTGFVVNTQLIIEPLLSLPPSDSEIGNSYRFETTMRLRTYIGTSSEMRLIKGIKVRAFDGGGIDSKIRVGSVFDGSLEELLSMDYSYQDLFDKRSGFYKYDHSEIHGDVNDNT